MQTLIFPDLYYSWLQVRLIHSSCLSGLSELLWRVFGYNMLSGFFVFVGIYCQPHSVSCLLCIRSSGPFIFQGYHYAWDSNSCWWFLGNVHFHSALFDLSVFLLQLLCSYLFLLDSCREDNPVTAGVVDKINIFRPDRVFMVMLHFHLICFPVSGFSENSLSNSRSLLHFLVFPCILWNETTIFIMQFIVEMHYKIAAAVHHRHKCHRLAGIEVLISILGHRAAVSSTSKWVYIEKPYVLVMSVIYWEVSN